MTITLASAEAPAIVLGCRSKKERPPIVPGFRDDSVFGTGHGPLYASDALFSRLQKVGSRGPVEEPFRVIWGYIRAILGCIGTWM